MKIKVETKKQIVLKCKSIFVWADFITPILCSENGSFMDTVIKNKNRNGYFYFLFWCLIIRHYSNIWIRMKLDTQAAYAFSKRLHKQFGEP